VHTWPVSKAQHIMTVNCLFVTITTVSRTRSMLMHLTMAVSTDPNILEMAKICKTCDTAYVFAKNCGQSSC